MAFIATLALLFYLHSQAKCLIPKIVYMCSYVFHELIFSAIYWHHSVFWSSFQLSYRGIVIARDKYVQRQEQGHRQNLRHNNIRRTWYMMIITTGRQSWNIFSLHMFIFIKRKKNAIIQTSYIDTISKPFINCTAIVHNAFLTFSVIVVVVI